MSRKNNNIARSISVCFLALCIPAFLIVNAVQSRKYIELRNDVIELEKKQEKLVEENKRLITEISQLSSSDRIESIAENELNMRQAESEEIVRVELREKKGSE